MSWFSIAIVVLWTIGFSLTFRVLWRKEVLAVDDAFVKCYRERERKAYNHYRWGDKTRLPPESWVNKYVECSHSGGHEEEWVPPIWLGIIWPLYWAYKLWWKMLFPKRIRSTALAELRLDLKMARQLEEVQAQLALGEQMLAATKAKSKVTIDTEEDAIVGRQTLPQPKELSQHSATTGHVSQGDVALLIATLESASTGNRRPDLQPWPRSRQPV